jgi:hypothetical protein
MHDPAKLRELARRCRERAQSSVNPAAAHQLRHWAVELADTADEIEWSAHDPGASDIARLLRPKGEIT